MAKELDLPADAQRELSAKVDALGQLVQDLWFDHLVDRDDPAGRVDAYREQIKHRSERPTIYPGNSTAEVELKREATRRAHEQLLVIVDDLGRQVRAAQPRQGSPVAANE